MLMLLLLSLIWVIRYDIILNLETAGTDTEATNEDKDENFVIAKITNQDKAKIIPK